MTRNICLLATDEFRRLYVCRNRQIQKVHPSLTLSMPDIMNQYNSF